MCAIPLKHIKEAEGNLYPIEFKDLPFEVKRVFYVTNVNDKTIRGEHAHRITEQILICIQGKIMVYLYDGIEHSKHLLNAGDSIYVAPMIFDSQVYLTGNDILMSLCSTEYDPKDYLHDIEEFERIVNEVNT